MCVLRQLYILAATYVFMCLCVLWYSDTVMNLQGTLYKTQDTVNFYKAIINFRSLEWSRSFVIRVITYK